MSSEQLKKIEEEKLNGNNKGMAADQTTNEDKQTFNELSSWKENNHLESRSSLGVKIPPKAPQAQILSKQAHKSIAGGTMPGTRNGTAPGISKKLLKMTFS